MIGEVTGLGAEFSAEQLRGYVLSGPDHRRRLNAALHAPIWAAMAKTGALFWEVPLLVEAGLTDWFDEVWLVTCGEAAQVERLRARGLSEGETVRLIGSQMRLSAKRVFCDAVIRTDPPFEHVRAITLELARTSLRRLAPPQQ
jgi:dephospho-CoA kinase